MSWKKLIWLILIAMLAAYTLAYASPAFLRITDIDNAIFQYAGKGILSGKIPYRDLYDHKPPAIFYLNGLGLALGGGSRWGIWALELLSLTTAGAICALYLRRFFGRLPAVIATAAFLLNLTFFHEGGNLTEEYALPFQFGALLCLALWHADRKPSLSAIGLGACIAAASSFKQPLGALAVSIGLYMILTTFKKDSRRLSKAVLWASLGFVVIWAGWFALFALNGALPQFWEAAFAYNFALSGISTARRLQALGAAVLTLFNTTPFSLLGLLAWLAALPYLLFNDQPLRKLATGQWIGWFFIFFGTFSLYNGIFRRGFTPYPAGQYGLRQIIEIGLGIALMVAGAVWLRTGLAKQLRERLEAARDENLIPIRLPLLVAAADLPIQLVMISLSGNNFGHYYMSVLPSLTVLCAFFFWYLLNNQPQKRQAVVWAVVFSLPVILVASITCLKKDRLSEDHYTRVMAQYVQSATLPNETIFYWGNLVPLYMESQRQSPSCFYFTDPLFLKGYTNQQHTGVFLKELQASPPAVIISASGVDRPLIYTEDPAQCASLADMETAQSLAAEQFHSSKVFIPEGMPEVYAWICANYTAEEVVLSENDNWVKTIYHYTPQRQTLSKVDAR